MYKCPNCGTEQEAIGTCTNCGSAVSEENKTSAEAEMGSDAVSDDSSAK
ncbi:hypothetical protein KW791_02700 [Candidatus Parcubacteria bacterium]|nr:hypothetical protein [Candidatus Parcubacteria bacterium]